MSQTPFSNSLLWEGIRFLDFLLEEGLGGSKGIPTETGTA